jgi:hypothetical protein
MHVAFVWAINGVLGGYHRVDIKALGYGQLVQHFVTALIALVFSVAAYCLLSLGIELWGSKDALLLTRLSDPLGACPIGRMTLLAAGLLLLGRRGTCVRWRASASKHPWRASASRRSCGSASSQTRMSLVSRIEL